MKKLIGTKEILCPFKTFRFNVLSSSFPGYDCIVIIVSPLTNTRIADGGGPCPEGDRGGLCESCGDINCHMWKWGKSVGMTKTRWTCITCISGSASHTLQLLKIGFRFCPHHCYTDMIYLINKYAAIKAFSGSSLTAVNTLFHEPCSIL